VQDLALAWRALLAPYSSTGDVEDTGRALLARWAEPHRRYHSIQHLHAVLDAVDELAPYASDIDAVRLAAWYHDAVYACRSDDEEQSALLAEADLGALGVPAALVAEVARLVRLTVEHDPAPDDADGAVLSDADLAALALPPAKYRENSAAIRVEYAHVPDDVLRAGRARVVEALLAAPALYRTPAGRDRWEQPARANLAAELSSLR
jgi:predicted metal-dependent HD superfamily phosphohydrolase